ncbi:MAG: hypothetical protein GTO14_15485 [Anaerolineales bacterium]|nr:hypothetical protein [Anaerolineales bacterium]
MRSSFLFFALFILIVAGCSKASISPTLSPRPMLTSTTVSPTVTSTTVSPTATLQPEDIELVPVVLERAGVIGVAPERWKFRQGAYYREDWPQDPAGLYIEGFPGLNLGRVLPGVVLAALGLEQLPESIGRAETEAFIWTLFYVEVDIPNLGLLYVDLGLSETEAGSFLVALTSGPEDYQTLHEQVFLPALEALKPNEYTYRRRITFDELSEPKYEGESPVNNIYFTPMGEIDKALHEFQGTLSVPEFYTSTSIPTTVEHASGLHYFPGFRADFFRHEEYLVPVVREILPPEGNNSLYRVILSPGRVWSESADQGMSRASFPFVLVVEDTSEARNGIATFLYDDTHVSSFRFQVVQEISGSIFDLWGQSPMQYDPHPIDKREALAESFANELASRVPVHPWEDLSAHLDPMMLDRFTGMSSPTVVSATGILLDGELYMQPCYSRYGIFPYCRNMRHGSFSVAKSMGAAMAMLRLAEKFGEEVFDLKIVDYVDISADHSGWDQVTFGDALNQATGIGDDVPEPVEPNVILADEDGDDPRFPLFIAARSKAEKTQVCSGFGDYPWGPGEVVRYNSCNTFLLSMAMDQFLKSMEGPQADIWDMILEEVFLPIGIYHAPIQRTLEPDGSRGVPVFAWGMYPTYEDAAKVSTLFLNGGRHDGIQILHAEKVAEALLQTDIQGLSSGEFNVYGEGAYHMSFWSIAYKAESGQDLQIPYMSGWGGNRVIFLPNDVVCFRFTDSHDYDALPMIEVGEAIRPFANP